MKLAGLAKTGLLLLTFLVLAAPETLSARPEFARYTGQSCGSCRVSALGGGSLTPDGEAFRPSTLPFASPLARDYSTFFSG